MRLSNKRIEVNLGRTVNLGNYESLRIDVSLGGDIPDGEGVSDNVDDIYSLLTNIINEKIMESKNK